MEKPLKVLTALALTTYLTVGLSSTTEASTQKVMWGKTELKVGQVGKITVLKDTPIYNIKDNNTITSVRNLKKGEEFRVYSYKNQNGGLYGVGGGLFILKDNTIKYETPSKSKLALLVTDKIKIPTVSLSGKEFTHEEVMQKLNKVVPEKYKIENVENSYLVKDIDTVAFGFFLHSDKAVKDNTYPNYKPIYNNRLGFPNLNSNNENYKIYLNTIHKLLNELGINNSEEDLIAKFDSVIKGESNNIKIDKAEMKKSSGVIYVQWDN